MRNLVLLKSFPGLNNPLTEKYKNLDNITTSFFDIEKLFLTPTYNARGEQFFDSELVSKKNAYNLLLQVVAEKMVNGQTVFIENYHTAAKDQDYILSLAKMFNYQVFVLDLTKNLKPENYAEVSNIDLKALTRLVEDNQKLQNHPKVTSIELADLDKIMTVPDEDFSRFNKLVIFGDIRSQAQTYKTLISESYDAGCFRLDDPKTAIIFIGNNFNVGIKQTETFETLLQLSNQGNVFFLEGVAEQKILEIILKYPKLDDLSLVEKALDLRGIKDVATAVKSIKQHFSNEDILKFIALHRPLLRFELNPKVKLLLTPGGLSRMVYDRFSTETGMNLMLSSNRDLAYGSPLENDESLKIPNVYQIHGFRPSAKLPTVISLRNGTTSGERLNGIVFNKSGNGKINIQTITKRNDWI